MIVIVTGSRNWTNKALFVQYLLEVERRNQAIGLIVHGDAKGADQLAEEFANDNKICSVTFHAEWFLLGSKAGPARNQRMLEWCLENKGGVPIVCVAYPASDSKGTRDMIRRCKKEGVKTYVIGVD